MRRESRWPDPLALVATRRYIGPCFLLFKKYIFRIIYLFYMGGWGILLFVVVARDVVVLLGSDDEWMWVALV